MGSGFCIELKDICKSFGGVVANDSVNISIKKGSVHGIVGENGAGKSTLMSILYGFYGADSGDIYVDGVKVDIRDSKVAINCGICMVHQHFMLVGNFTVLENIILGVESSLLVDEDLKKARDVLGDIERTYKISVRLDAITQDLPVGDRQKIEILKALYRNAKVLILDEPTAVLTPSETDALFDVLRVLKNNGVTIILITHKLKEVMAVTDFVTVMRKGKDVCTMATSDTNHDKLARLMVGKEVLSACNKKEIEDSEVFFSVDELYYKDTDGIDRLNNVSFEIRSGEILGVAGVSGNGQSELLEILSGMSGFNGGEIHIKDFKIDCNTPYNSHIMRQNGVAHIPEDRTSMGIIGSFLNVDNSLLGHHKDDRFNKRCLLNSKSIYDDCLKNLSEFDVRPPLPNIKSANLSGGNQQKLILSREMSKKADIILVGQPTRGVDIGSIELIHKRLIELRNSGAAILLVSSELDEIMDLSDRIVVMFEGKIVGELDCKDDFDTKDIALMMANAI